ncbi:hypothetical protein M9H77_16901 [Catharanthus roseus]|uniref:Uncharacterized protein n=1 Tax=Catharanthus roseus TaxID=4058 RepID=A0ACC0B340_CATRO|nr:hypothetical protein M9H77_16901 [Catharanthus roseus]
MYPFDEFLQENIGFEGDEDPNTFEEFLEPKEYMDLGHSFTTDRIFSSKDELVDWVKQTAMDAKTYLIITRYQRSRTLNRRPYITLACERGGSVKKYKKPIVDNEEEEIPKKRRGPYGTKKCGCPFKLKGEQMATSENWQLFIHNGRHNHKIVVYSHGHAQAARLTEEQLQQTEQFKKSHGRNTVEEVLCLSAERDYTVFHRNREESNVLSDIVVAHPTSIAMIRTWTYVLIMDTTYKTNKYNMPLLECVGMTPTGKNFTVATAFMCNEQATIYRWVFQQIKHFILHLLCQMVRIQLLMKESL